MVEINKLRAGIRRPSGAAFRKNRKKGENEICLVFPFFQICRRSNRRAYGFLKFQRPLSLLGSNLAKVGVLAPIAVKTRGSLDLSIDLGMMR